MSIDFSKVAGISDSYGDIVEIKDSAGRVIWSAGGKPIVLQVEKITSDTYAGETTYTDESFILLNIYPKTNGTVKVTYGGLTKTITDTSGAEEPNAQQVFFGTFNGVSDSVTTPDSGEVTIDGSYYAFSVGEYYANSKEMPFYCSCVTAVDDLGGIKIITDKAFRDCIKLTSITIPDSITSIGNYAFSYCKNLVLSSLPSGIVSLGGRAFGGCYSLQFNDNFFKEGLVSIGSDAFSMNSYGDYGDEDAYAQSQVITIPSTVTDIGANAFAGPVIDAHQVTTFQRVTCLPKTPPTYTDDRYSIFGKVYKTGFTIIVPNGCGAAYKAAPGWSEYADYIVEAT